MFKFETVVHWVMLVLMLNTHLGSAFAADKIIQGGDDSPAQLYKYLNCATSNNPECPKLLKKIEFIDGSDCKSLEDQFQKVKGEYSDACSAANIGGSKCTPAILKCYEKDDNGEDASERHSRKKDPSKPLDVDGETAKYNKCPSMAGEDLEKYEKQEKEQQEKVKKLEKEIPDLEEKANKVMRDTQKDLKKNLQDQGDAQKKLAEDLQRLSDERDGAEKAIMDQITNITAQIAKANDALSQLSVTKMEGQLKLKQTKTQADLNCHASASAQVAKMQTDVLAAQTTGTYNRSGFTGMLKNVGLTDRQSWQRTAQKYYRWCLDSKPTVDTKDGANDGYKLLVAQSDKSEASIREQIKQLQAQQLQLTSPTGCGQAVGVMNGETAVCQSARKGAQKANQAQQNYVTDIQRLKSEYADTQQQGTREYQSFENQARQKNQEIQDEKNRLENLRQLLQAKYDHTSSNVDSKATDKAASKRDQLISVGVDLLNCKGDESTLQDGDYCIHDNSCKSVKNYLHFELKADQADPERLNTEKSPTKIPTGKEDDSGDTGGQGTPPKATPISPAEGLREGTQPL